MTAYAPTDLGAPHQTVLDLLWEIRRELEGMKAALTAGPRLAYSMPEVCKVLDKSEPVIRGWIATERLKGTRSGLDGKSGAWMFSPEAVIAARDWQPAVGVAVEASPVAKEVRQ